LTETKGNEALYQELAASGDMQFMMFFGNLVPRMVELKKKREIEEAHAKAKAEASGQRYHGLTHDAQFEGRMILHKARISAHPTRKWTSYEDYDIDLDKSLPAHYIPKDVGDMLQTALKYGKDPLLYLMHKLGHQKPDLLAIDLACGKYH
jgi:hypothetical protein